MANDELSSTVLPAFEGALNYPVSIEDCWVGVKRRAPSPVDTQPTMLDITPLHRRYEGVISTTTVVGLPPPDQRGDQATAAQALPAASAPGSNKDRAMLRTRMTYFLTGTGELPRPSSRIQVTNSKTAEDSPPYNLAYSYVDGFPGASFLSLVNIPSGTYDVGFDGYAYFLVEQTITSALTEVGSEPDLVVMPATGISSRHLISQTANFYSPYVEGVSSEAGLLLSLGNGGRTRVTPAALMALLSQGKANFGVGVLPVTTPGEEPSGPIFIISATRHPISYDLVKLNGSRYEYRPTYIRLGSRLSIDDRLFESFGSLGPAFAEAYGNILPPWAPNNQDTQIYLTSVSSLDGPGVLHHAEGGSLIAPTLASWSACMIPGVLTGTYYDNGSAAVPGYLRAKQEIIKHTTMDNIGFLPCRPHENLFAAVTDGKNMFPSAQDLRKLMSQSTIKNIDLDQHDRIVKKCRSALTGPYRVRPKSTVVKFPDWHPAICLDPSGSLRSVGDL